MTEKKRGTHTSNFGVSRRESHDSTAFYSRFTVPEISDERTINKLSADKLDRIYCGDSRDMDAIDDNSIALVVTSPPYFAGKEYEEALGDGHVPADYVEFLEMLHDVFADCVRVLEPGGRIAVNVANLGRRPYRSLASDVIHILQDELKLLLRGEIIWQKGQGAAGSCAWGSFQSAANPVLRDITERVIVASKGRFDRAVSRRQRAQKDLPSDVTIFKDEFMEATLDLWDIPPESATRVGHPAPFPVELPKRLIELYTYRGDVVLDPFCGSGSLAVAAVRTDRHFVCYDIDPDYVEVSERRVEEERLQRKALARTEVRISVDREREDPDEPFQSRAVRQGRRAKEIALALLQDVGFERVEEDRRFGNGVEINFVAHDQKGRPWFFDVSGAFTSNRPGLRRTDTLWKALGRAAVLKSSYLSNYRLVFLTTDLPPKGSAGHNALLAVRGSVFHDAIAMLSAEGQDRLRKYADGDGWKDPIGELLA